MDVLLEKWSKMPFLLLFNYLNASFKGIRRWRDGNQIKLVDCEVIDKLFLKLPFCNKLILESDWSSKIILYATENSRWKTKVDILNQV